MFEFIEKIHCRVSNFTKEDLTSNSVLDRKNLETMDFAAAKCQNAGSAWHLFALVYSVAVYCPDKIYIREEGGSYTYAQTVCIVVRLAQRMSKDGLLSGDRVLIVGKNSAAIIFHALAASLKGSIFVIIDSLTSALNLRQIIAETGPKIVAVDMDSSWDATPVHVPRYHLDVANEMVSQSILLIEAEHFLNQLTASPDDVAFLVYTSGSTGSPKGAIITLGNLRFSIAAIEERLRYRETDTIGVFLPLSFDYGLYQVFLAANCRATVYLGSKFQAGALLGATLASEGITVLPVVPTLLANLIRVLRSRPSSLQLSKITSTGDNLPPALIVETRSRFPGTEIYCMYGLTECKRVSILMPAELESKMGSVGRPLDGTEVYVVDENGERVPPGTVGELVVQGPHLVAGYWMDNISTAKRFPTINGRRCLMTGDQCCIDNEGYIFHKGRLDSTIKRRGFRFSLMEVENALYTISGIASVVVAYRRDEDKLDCKVVRINPQLDEKTIKEHLVPYLEEYKRPDRIVFVNAIATGINGKILRNI